MAETTLIIKVCVESEFPQQISSQIAAMLREVESVTLVEIKKSQVPSYTLEELLEGVTPENCHRPTDWGSPVGNEFW
jgi:antitoxin component of MazEF toxin-antitoxin module